jgi:hypothetical protein
MPYPHKKTANFTLNQTLNVKDHEHFCNNVLGLLHNLPVGRVEKECFSLPVDRPFCKMVAKKVINLLLSPKENLVGISNLSWEDTHAMQLKHTLVYSFTWEL